MSTPPAPYGVVYTPSTHQPYIPLGIDDILSGYIRLQWTDLTNITRFRVLPIHSFKALLKSTRPGVGITEAALGIVGAALAEGFSGTGEYVYVPDMTSLRVCKYAPGHASVMGWFEKKEPEDEDRSVELCPRTLLRRVEEDADAAGVQFLVGIETEFVLLDSIDPIVPTSYAPWSSSAKLRSGSASTAILEEIADVLRTGGIDLIMYHAEAAPGQYEIVTGPLAPLQAADALVFTRETIYNVAAKHGKHATFAPRLFPDNCGSAAHVNISVHRKDGSKDPADDILNALERSFLQGLLAHLPALAALTLPTAASYGRVQDGVWAGGTYVCWGRDNREAPVRVTGSKGARRFEVRCVDGTASPYVALAGLLGAGLRGVKDRAALTVKEYAGMAAALNDMEREELGIVQRLPRNLTVARRKLEADQVVKDILGATFVEKYLAVNKMLEKSLSADTPAAEVKKLVESY